MSAAERRHLESIFRGVRHTLLNRGLYRNRKDGGVQEVAWKRTLLIRDLGVVAFEVDTLRLPVRLEQLLDPGVAHQMQASLGGRQVWPVNSSGLAYCIKLEPEEPKPQVRLPRRVPLDLDTRPAGAYLIPVGQGEGGPVWRSLLDTGHILVGGETGSGKSTWLNAALTALLDAHGPDTLKLAIVDPKGVEFTWCAGLAHLVEPVATTVESADEVIAGLAGEMDRRGPLFAGLFARNLSAYNAKVLDHRVKGAPSSTEGLALSSIEGPLPLILAVVDEVTDIALQAGLKSSFYTNLIRLASKGRSLGIMLILATQNPKAEVLNTLIRGNMSTRIAFRVATTDHARTILGLPGAEKLPRTIRGRLLARLDGEPVTLQGFYLSDDELLALARRLGGGQPPTLSGVEAALVRHAVEELDGAFTVNKLYDTFKGQLSHHFIKTLAQEWERQRLLTKPAHATDSRRVTPELLVRLRQGCPQDDLNRTGAQGEHTARGRTGSAQAKNPAQDGPALCGACAEE